MLAGRRDRARAPWCGVRSSTSTCASVRAPRRRRRRRRPGPAWLEGLVLVGKDARVPDGRAHRAGRGDRRRRAGPADSRAAACSPLGRACPTAGRGTKRQLVRTLALRVHPRGRRRQPAVPAVGAAREAGGAVRRQVPHHRLHALELRELRHLRRRRAHAVPPDVAEPAHRHRPAVGPRPHARRHPDPAAVARRGRERLVPGHGRRDLPEPDPPAPPPHRAGAGAVGRSRLPDGLQRALRVPRREPRVGHGGGHRGARGRVSCSASSRPRRTGASPGSRRSRKPRGLAARVDGRLPVRSRSADPLAGRGRGPRQDSSHDFGKDLLPRLVARGEGVFAYRFPDYWQDVGTLDSYYDANLAFLSDTPPLELDDPEWVVHTQSADRPPVRFEHGAQRRRAV